MKYTFASDNWAGGDERIMKEIKNIILHLQKINIKTEKLEDILDSFLKNKETIFYINYFTQKSISQNDIYKKKFWVNLFDFLDTDWFIITLEIVFLILIVYDIKKYVQTKKKEYITNIVLTFGFEIWTLYPMYNSYFGWEDEQKQKMLVTCNDTNNTKLCNCIDEKIFKEYIYDEYKILDENSSDYKEFIKDAKEEWLDNSWF